MAANTNIEDLRFTIYINNQQANKALIDLDTVTRKLEADIKQMINTGQHETADYKAKKTALAAVSKEYYDLDVRQKALAAQTKTLIAEGKQETAQYALVRKEFDHVTAAKSKAKVASDALQKEINQLVAAGKHETAEFKAANAAMAQNKAKMQALTKQAGLHALSIKQLIALKAQLNREFKAAIPGSEGRIRLERELGAVNARLKQLNGTAKGFSLGKLADGFNKYFGIATAAIASFTGAAFTMKKLSEDVAKMDDVYADVMKTTGLTRDAVVDINEEFKNMDTRTAREDLNKLASEAGKLGIEGTENIMGFVDAGNQIKVALGEDLGEDAIKNVGKMVGVFKKSSDELKDLDLKGQMLAVGSAVNELGASSSASEDYLVQFAGRLGGVASQANISISAILGFGSALDQDMQQVEMAATALQTFIIKIMGDPAKFAKLAGLEVGKFTQLLKTDANAAIKQVLSALNEKGGFQDLVPVFEEMGLEGVRATGVLSSMAGSIDKIDEAQRLANKAMVEGTSITKEYDIKNENLAAKLDKAKKRFKEIALDLGEKLGPAFIKATSWTGKFMSLISVLIDFFIKYKNGIISITAGLAAYTIVVKAAKYWDDAHYYLLLAKDKAAKIYSLTVGIITGKIKLATIAQRAWNAAKSAGAGLWGILIAAIVAAAVYIVKFNKSMHEQEKLLNNFKNKISEVVSESNSLFEQLKKTNPGTKERADLLGIINEKYGDYLKGMNLEVAGLKQIEEAQQRVNNKLIENLVLEAKQAEIKELAAAQANILLKLGEKGIYLPDLTEGKGAMKKYVIWADNEIQSLSEAYFNLGLSIDSVGEKYNQVADGIRKSLTNNTNLSTGPKEGDTKTEDGVTYVFKNGVWEIVENKGGGGNDGKADEKAAEDKLKKIQEITQKYNQQFFEDQLSTNEKEREQIRQKYDAELQSVGITEQKIAEIKAKGWANINETEKAMWSAYDANREAMHRDQEAKEKEHQAKLAQAKLDAQEEIWQATLDGEEAEMVSAMQKYDTLFELAYKNGLDTKELREKMDIEMGIIHKKYLDKEVSDAKEAEDKKRKERQKSLQTTSDIAGGLLDIVNGIQQIEIEKAGENEEKKKAIQKKYADIQMVITIGKIIAATAMGAMQAYELGPVGGAIMSGVIIAEGIVEAGYAIAQRNKIKSLAAGGYTGPGEGLPDETGYKVAGKVHEKEYVTPEWELKIPEVAQYVKQIEKVRKRGYATRGDFSTASSRYSQAMLSGVVPQNYQMNTTRVMSAIKTQGYDLSRQSSATHTEMTFNPKTLEVMESFTNIMKDISENGIYGKWVVRDLKEIQDKYDEVKKNFGG